MTHLVLLLPSTSRRDPDAAYVRSVLTESHASLVAFQVPAIAGDGDSLDKDQFVTYPYQQGVNLLDVGADFRLRELILLKLPRKSAVGFCVIYLWSWPDSTFDIDSVRVPWEEKPDPRDNPLGKNPGNIWAFSEPLTGRARAIQTRFVEPPAPERVCRDRIDVQTLERLTECHTEKNDTVYVWGDPADQDSICAVAARLSRECKTVPSGASDPPRGIELPVEEYPVEPSPLGQDGLLSPRAGSTKHPPAELYVSDCRFGMQHVALPPVEDVVTSPPYNIGYRPFNVPKPNQKTRTLLTPGRKGYEDEIPAPQYYHLIRSTFHLVDERLDKNSADVFVNVKNDYGESECKPPFWLISMVPSAWSLSDLLIWRYDISYDPAVGKYKPYYEWIFRFTKGRIRRRVGHRYLRDFYEPILKGNSRERRDLVSPAVYPKAIVRECLRECSHTGLVMDPFLGSGTTIAAAWEMHRRSVGFELKEDFVRDIELRIRRARR